VRWGCWQWFPDEAAWGGGWGPSPVCCVDTMATWRRALPGPADVILKPLGTTGDTAQSLVVHERGDWGRETYAGSFNGLVGRGVRLQAILHGDDWGGDRQGASWSEQHFEGRLLGPRGWFGLRRRRHKGGVLEAWGEDGLYEEHRDEGVSWAAGLNAPWGARVRGEWMRNEEKWKGDGTSEVWFERGVLELDYQLSSNVGRIVAETRWVRELVGRDKSDRFEELQVLVGGRVRCGQVGRAEGWLETRSDEIAGWGLAMELAEWRGWRAVVLGEQSSGWRGAREAVADFPSERWRGASLRLGRVVPWEWTLWANLGKARGALWDPGGSELPWWEDVREEAEADLYGVGAVSRAEWKAIRLAGWLEHVGDAGDGQLLWRPAWRGVLDGSLRVGLKPEVLVEIGGMLRGEDLRGSGEREDLKYISGTVWGGLHVSRALLYVCVVQPTGRMWEEVPGYPLPAPMVYGGIQWSFLN
jgi:hypothetical protein